MADALDAKLTANVGTPLVEKTDLAAVPVVIERTAFQYDAAMFIHVDR